MKRVFRFRVFPLALALAVRGVRGVVNDIFFLPPQLRAQKDDVLREANHNVLLLNRAHGDVKRLKGDLEQAQSVS